MTQDETNLIPGAIWYDPKSQRIVIIQNIDVITVSYHTIGTDTTYTANIETFLDKFTWQSHSPRSKTLDWA
jgi:hypothetical protein